MYPIAPPGTSAIGARSTSWSDVTVAPPGGCGTALVSRIRIGTATVPEVIEWTSRSTYRHTTIAMPIAHETT